MEYLGTMKGSFKEEEIDHVNTFVTDNPLI